jgi:hypothetical protein
MTRYCHNVKKYFDIGKRGHFRGMIAPEALFLNVLIGSIFRIRRISNTRVESGWPEHFVECG